MEIGLIGLPNAGKSTLFNAVTKAGAEVAPYPFTTTGEHVGVASVPDERLAAIASVTHPKKLVPATVKFVDIAGLVRGASHGEGLGNQFLSFIRNVDAVAHVVRAFSDPNVTHVDGAVHPGEDVDTVNTELVLADLAAVERSREKAARQAKSGDRGAQGWAGLLDKVKAGLERGELVRRMGLSAAEEATLAESDLALLTDKPTLYVANVDEDDLGASSDENPMVAEVRAHAEVDGAEVVVVSAKIEAELAELPEDEQADFMAELGLGEAGLAKLVHAGYHLLDLITFFTIESDECRAWTALAGAHAPQCAGCIHTDMERGFIKAEVVNWKDLVDAGSFHEAREHGHLMVEGREYVVKDGDVILFKFAV